MEYKPDVDSVMVSRGKFTFEGSVEYPELYVIHNRRDSILGFFRFFLEPAKMYLDIDADDWSWGSQINGGQVSEEYNNNIRNDETALVHLNPEIDEKKSLADSTEQILAGFSDQNKMTSICMSLQEKLDMMNEYNSGSTGTE
jgi:hypothetical protein